jgi:hypothetical protein
VVVAALDALSLQGALNREHYKKLELVSPLFENSRKLTMPEAALAAEGLARKHRNTPAGDAMDTALSILRKESVVWDSQLAVASGRCRFCNLDRVWELTLGTLLQRFMGSPFEVQFHPFASACLRLFEPHGPSIDPDLVIYRDECCEIVVDAKYSVSESARADDIYQIACYARRLHVKSAILVYVSSVATWVRRLGNHEGCEVIAAGVDHRDIEQGILQIAKSIIEG